MARRLARPWPVSLRGRAFRSRRRRTMVPGMRVLRLLSRVAGFFGGLVLLALYGVGAVLFLCRPLPHEDTVIPGLSGPVTIAYDGDGIPRIRAASEVDGAAGLGWVHARDRLFQMELMRRAASGQISELAGERALPLDRTMRVLGLRHRAEQEAAGLPPDTRAMLEAYARGVNAYVARHGRWSAVQFAVLGRPLPWTAGRQHAVGQDDGHVPVRQLGCRAEPRRPGRDRAAHPDRCAVAAAGRHPRAGCRRRRPALRRAGRRSAGRRAALPGPVHPAGHGVQRVGRGRRAQHHGRAAAGRRPAPRLQHARHLVPGADRHAGRHAGRRHRTRRAAAGDRPQQPHRLDLHHHGRRHAGRVHRDRAAGRPLRHAGRPAPRSAPGSSTSPSAAAPARTSPCARPGTAPW